MGNSSSEEPLQMKMNHPLQTHQRSDHKHFVKGWPVYQKLFGERSIQNYFPNSRSFWLYHPWVDQGIDRKILQLTIK